MSKQPSLSPFHRELLELEPGSRYLGNGKTRFCVWAPFRDMVEVDIQNGKKLSLTKDEYGYWTGTAEETQPGDRYFYILDRETERPDPASRLQAEGVHGRTEVTDDAFEWTDQDWQGIPLAQMVQYELHTGTFSSAGTFQGVIEKIPYLKELGINTIEIMPVSQFPGSRNWGYDGVFPFAVQTSYGGHKGLKELVNACHRSGLAVILDVVYNHMGPEGNYLNDYGPYFTDRYGTPWGKALNFDDSYCDHVRNFFIHNALMWFRDFHIDALRLDAVHAIFDHSGFPFLRQLSETVKEFNESTGRRHCLIAESDLNDIRTLSGEPTGMRMDAQWLDDFHHAVHAVLTGETIGYYEDFGKIEDLHRAFTNGFIYDGRYSPFRKRVFGTDASEETAGRFVAFIQNHDQTGNRMLGDRLSRLLNFEQQKLAAVLLFTAPYIPMLFMGEEYGETHPFYYFVSHTDKELVEAVRNGRKKEFEGFKWEGTPPDPQSEDTFMDSKLSLREQWNAQQKALFSLYKKLIRLKKEHEVLSVNDKRTLSSSFSEEEKWLQVSRWHGDDHVHIIFNISDTGISQSLPGTGHWKKILDTAAQEYSGPGATAPDEAGKDTKINLPPYSAVIFQQLTD